MESEFYHLYNTVSSFDKSIIKNLKKIDEELLQAVNDYTLSLSRQEHSKKYKISVGMIGVLESYVRISFLAETALKDLRIKLASLQRDSAPERDSSSRSLNPIALAEAEPSENGSASDTETLRGSDFMEGNEIKHEPAQEIVSTSRESETVTTPQISETGATPQISETVVISEIGEEPPQEVTKDEPSTSAQNTKITKKEAQKAEIIKSGPSRTGVEEEVTPNLETSRFTALEKILTMNVNDRRKEAERIYDEKHVDGTELKWKTVPKSPKIEKEPKENSTIYEIQDDTLAVDQICTICHVETPSEFYVRTNQQLFELMEACLNDDLNAQFKYVISNFKSKQEAKSVIGNFAFIYLKNQHKWFRVEILDWLDSQPKEILIRSVDYGHKYFSRYENLKSMSAFYAEFPKMAIKCHFASLLAPDGSDSWPRGSVDALIELSEMYKMTKFIVIYAYKEDDSYSVDLTKHKNEKTISEILIENDLARQFEIPTEDKQSEMIFEHEEEYDNINEAIAGYDARDEARICPFTDDSGKCFKGPSCKLEHAKLSEDGVTTDKMLVYTRAFEELPLPANDEHIQIVVTGYKTTCHFFAQIRSYGRGIPSSHYVDFEKLEETMSSSNITKTYTPFKIFPGTGEILMAKHSSFWYRARCLSMELDQIKVFLVDYGKIVNKQMSELRQIREDFLHVPFQAVEFVLDDVTEKNGIAPQKSWGFFEKVMVFKEFRAVVLGNAEPVRIKMYDDKGLDMSYVLKEYGIAQNSVRMDCLIPLAP